MSSSHITIPFHSDLDREVSIWLYENRNLTPAERIDFVSKKLRMAGKGILLHYASSGFVCRDAMLAQTQRFGQIIPEVLKGSADIANRFEKSKKSKDAKIGGDKTAENHKKKGAASRKRVMDAFKRLPKYEQGRGAPKRISAMTKLSVTTVRRYLPDIDQQPS